MPIAFHTMHTLRDRRVIFTTPEARALAYRAAVRIGARFGLGWFHLGVDHIHAVLFCSREDVGRWAQAIESSWTQLIPLEVGFAPYHCKPVTDQGHLTTLLRYVLQQEQRHHTHLDPLHIGSNGPDLAGGRVPPSPQAELVRRYLPRVRARDIDRMLLGSDRLPLSSVASELATLAPAGIHALLRGAAGRAVGRHDLPGICRTPTDSAIVRALADLCARPDLASLIDASAVLGRSSRSIRRLRSQPAPPAATAALEWQITFALTRLALD